MTSLECSTGVKSNPQAATPKSPHLSSQSTADMPFQRKQSRNNSNSYRRSRAVHFCMLVSATLIVCQYGDIFVPEVIFAILGHDLQANPPYAMQKYLKEAHKLDAREAANQEHDRSRREAQKEMANKRKRSQKHDMDDSRNITIDKEVCNPFRKPTWEYQSYSTNQDTKASKKLLIGLYSGFGVYSHLLTKTAHINRVYASHWHHDVVLVQGAALRIEDIDGECEPPPYRAAYNKIPLLQYALQHKDQYDQLLILDTDAIIYEMDFDITTLLPAGRVLAAQKVKRMDNHETWDINNGVTLWDLHHPRVEALANEWLASSEDGVRNNHHSSNDQFHLHRALKEGNYEKDVYALVDEFKYAQGTVIKHFIRNPTHKQWGEAEILDNREDRIEIVIDQICKSQKMTCESVKKTVYNE